ncbi:MAG: hypothetical protein EAZ57_08275 [Cytophagales bacterium]|nr:MAG: hypothetical protein EAZ67_09350 [Cytophagales bacterium]TAF60329.1 MAG: hypothetical protein EAZ57_08275 [Cytophagales bacterium]
MGKIRKAKESELWIVYQYNPFSQKKDTLKALLDIKRNYSLQVPLNQATFVSLVCGSVSELVFLEPSDSLFLSSDMPDFKKNMSFSGRGAANNACLQAFLKDPVASTLNAPEMTGIHHETVLMRADASFQYFEELRSQYKVSKSFNHAIHDYCYWQPLSRFLEQKSLNYNLQTVPELYQLLWDVHKNSVEDHYLAFNPTFALQYYYLLYAHFCKLGNSAVEMKRQFYHYLKAIPETALSEILCVTYALHLAKLAENSLLQDLKPDLMQHVSTPHLRAVLQEL